MTEDALASDRGAALFGVQCNGRPYRLRSVDRHVGNARARDSDGATTDGDPKCSTHAGTFSARIADRHSGRESAPHTSTDGREDEDAKSDPACDFR